MAVEGDGSVQSGYVGASVPWQYGWRLVVVLFTLFSGLFLSTLETTIVATSLVSISSELGEFQKSNWIPVAYLITYTSFLIIFARLSDIYGRKQLLIFSVTFFMIFSAACGAAQSMVQLIILRALQGAGGSGIYSCTMGVLREVSPPNTYGRVTGILGIVFALSSVIGPLLGGVIVSHTTWRWIFLLNLPPCAVILVLLFAFFPSNTKIEPAGLQSLRKLDYPGVALSLAASVTLIYGIEAGSVSQSWAEPSITICLTSAVYLWLAFAAWETYLNTAILRPRMGKVIPVFPIRLIKHRVVGFTVLAGFLSGFAFFAAIINIPQRYQIVNGLTPARAGINLIPLLIMSAFGAGLTGWVCARIAIDWYVLVASCALQVVSLGLLSTLSTTKTQVQPAEYGYEAMLGLGFGSFNTCLIMITRSMVGGKDQAVTIGAITQARTLGGVIGLAIAQVVLFNDILSALRGRIVESDLQSFLQSVDALDSLPPSKVALITREYASGFNTQMRTVMYFSIAALVVCFFVWRKDPQTFDQVNAMRTKAEQETMESQVSENDIDLRDGQKANGDSIAVESSLIDPEKNV